MKHFFITGLPRSRTAWLANLLTTDTSVCYHEKIRECDSFEKYIVKMTTAPVEKVGDSSSGHLLFYRQMVQTFPDAKWVLVERNPQEAFEAAVKAFPQFDVPVQAFRDARVHMQQLKNAVPVNKLTVIEYSKLNESLGHICDWVGVPVPAWRREALEQMKVEIHMPSAQAHGCPVWAPRTRNVPLLQERVSVEYAMLVREMCGNNMAACQWIWEVCEVAQIWDHIVDGDYVEKDVANEMFCAMLLNWPNNPFYSQHGALLVPVLHNAILDWRTGDLSGAYRIYTELPLAVALILGGRPLAEKYSPIIRQVVQKVQQQDQLNDNIW